ncbi:30S ribosomal protein S4e [Candidatus Woesearchaeota archaeon]|nr:30S ribosomal protein S4e [Candidatus Woesearchaeota archaeon]
MTHLKKLHAPWQWHISRKEKKYVVRPLPGGHKRELSLPILVIMRDMLHYVQSARELRKVLQQNGVLVDGKKLEDIHSSVGLFDVVYLPKTREYYRLLLNRSDKLLLTPIDIKESGIKVCKVTSKHKVKGGKMQIALHDGRTFIIEHEKDVSVGDSVVLQLPDKKLAQILRLKKGAYVYLTDGKHSGNHGVLREITETEVAFEDGKNNKLETLKEYVIVLGEGKPLLKLDHEQ